MNHRRKLNIGPADLEKDRLVVCYGGVAMLKGTRELLKFLWPLIESIIIASIFGIYNHSLAFTITILIGTLIFTYIYGVNIRVIGWGVVGFVAGEQSYLLVNLFVAILFIVVRFGIFKATKV